ncbi:MAG: ABC transporter ATP-binding protein [Atribacterota bacterium]
MLELRNISKIFGDIVAVDGLNLEVQDGEFFVILGPTGAGKTTTLRIVMGLEKPDSGEVYYDGQEITHVAPPLRNFAFMFESHNLYPVLNVYDNLAFPLRSPLFRVPEDEVKRRVENIARELHITHLLKRKVSHLSGGEQQRVALGRALVRRPRIYILDEPISSLDYKLREELQTEFKRIHEEYGITILSATHDNISAMAMASRIGIMEHGRIIQVGSPREVYINPVNVSVARIIGAPSMNFLECNILNGQLAIKDRHDYIFKVRSEKFKFLEEKLRGGDRVLVGIWPESILVSGSADEAWMKAAVENVEYHGAEKFVNLNLGGWPIKALLPGDFVPRHGSEVFVLFPEENLYFFYVESGMRIYTN